jgi:hypothetical protein
MCRVTLHDRNPGTGGLRRPYSTPLLPGIDVVINTEERGATDVAGEIFELMRGRGRRETDQQV